LLDPHAVHVWLTDPDRIPPDLLAAYDSLLTPDERAKQQRFMFEKGRRECLVTRALVRTTLSRYADVAPRDWRFVPNEHGRPDIAPGLVRAPLRFNLSHTDGLIACAVSLERDVGVDVEYLDRRGPDLDVAERFFSALEVRELRALPASEQRDRFFCYWTLKESYIKARGMGLALPLDKFSFHLGERPIRITIDPSLGDDASAWQFELQRPDAAHLLAVGAWRGGGSPQLAVTAEWTVPLGPGSISRR
jgi:4'-phosphopantetheinyl transferase